MGGTPILDNKQYLYRKYLTKNEIFELISKCDGQIFGEKSPNATNNYYKVVPYYQKYSDLGFGTFTSDGT